MFCIRPLPQPNGPANAWICRRARTLAATGLAVALPGDRWLRDPVSYEDRASRPVQEALPASPAQVDAQTPRCQTADKGKSCSSAAGRLRSDAVGTSPSAISLAEHRVEFGVGSDLPDLLRAAAGGGDLGSPLQCLLT